MRLVEAGKLDLDEPLSAYDPGYAQWCAELKRFPVRAGASPYMCETERITVRHHLTHTAEGKPGSVYRYNGFLFARLSAVIRLAEGFQARGRGGHPEAAGNARHRMRGRLSEQGGRHRLHGETLHGQS